jgi:GntR family transcriptional regulator
MGSPAGIRLSPCPGPPLRGRTASPSGSAPQTPPPSPRPLNPDVDGGLGVSYSLTLLRQWSARVIRFRVDGRSAVPPYQQIVQQVRQALRMGVLDIGDQLPSVREAVAAAVVNTNTVLKAYRELEREGLVEARTGQGTFVRGRPPGPPPGTHARLGRSLRGWVREARAAGLDDESIESLLRAALQADAEADIA